jgi:anti-sigma factor (TIGR02949 family)
MSTLISSSCQELVAALSTFLDGELDAAQCERIKQHLATCPNCRTVLDTTRKTIQIFQGGRDALPPQVHEHLIAALEQEQLVYQRREDK